MTKMSGGCLCGSVRYSSEAEPLMTALCHCKNCQKQSGSAYSLNLAIPIDSLHIEGDSLKAYQDTGTDTQQPVWRHFCGQCGSPIYTKVDVAPALAFVKGGTLDDTSDVRPQINIWCASAQSWINLDDGLQQAERNPDLG